MISQQTAIFSDQPGLWFMADMVPLQNIHVSVELTHPLAMTRMTQRFQNDRSIPIEARYVFPVPYHAVLTGLRLIMGTSVLEGVVVTSGDADDAYEKALSKGDAAIQVRRLTDTLYALQVGNILPNECVSIEVSWVECLRWHHNSLVYRLPCLVAPHYGNPSVAGLAPDDVPTHSAAVAYPLHVEARISGDLLAATVTSATHALIQSRDHDALRVTLAEDAWLDRAMSLELQMAHTPQLVAWSAGDGGGTALLAAVVPEAAKRRTNPKHMTLVIDASGSMEGESIAQASAAVLRILDQLDGQDTVFIMAFGSEARAITPVRVSVNALDKASRHAIKALRADLGGTELVSALKLAVKQTPEGGDLLLLTDGQAYVSDHEINQLAATGKRFFTIGVGRETSEDVLQALAEKSHGACVLVSSQEDMTAPIVQQIHRALSQPVAQNWLWEVLPDRVLSPASIFSGDLSLTSARFNIPITGSIELTLNGRTLRVEPQQAPEWLASLLPRIVANSLLPKDNLPVRRAEAIHYQLVTNVTSMVAVKERDLKLSHVVMPEIVDVPVMHSFSMNMSRRLSVVIDSDVDFSSSALRRMSAHAIDDLTCIDNEQSILVEQMLQLQEFWAELNSHLGRGLPLEDWLKLSFLPDAIRLLLPSRHVELETEDAIMRQLLQQCVEAMSFGQKRKYKNIVSALNQN